MEYKNILLSVEGEIGILTINRPKALNALNIETLQDIQMAIREIKEDPALRVLILTGAGEKAFVAGADISEMRGMSPIEAVNFSRKGHQTLDMWGEVQKSPLLVISFMPPKMQDLANRRSP